jgi:hypothetical protein
LTYTVSELLNRINFRALPWGTTTKMGNLKCTNESQIKLASLKNLPNTRNHMVWILWAGLTQTVQLDWYQGQRNKKLFSKKLLLK